MTEYEAAQAVLNAARQWGYGNMISHLQNEWFKLLKSEGLNDDTARRGAEMLQPYFDDIDRLQNWIKDLQAGMYINCVYCGHRYGPDTEVPASMADVLKDHVEHCPKHPMSALKKENNNLKALVTDLQNENDQFRLALKATKDALEDAFRTAASRTINLKDAGETVAMKQWDARTRKYGAALDKIKEIL